MPTLTITYDINTIKADLHESVWARDAYEQMNDNYAVEGVSVKDIHNWDSFTEYFNDLLWPAMKDHLTEDQLAYLWYDNTSGVGPALNTLQDTIGDYISKEQEAFLKENGTVGEGGD